MTEFHVKFVILICLNKAFWLIPFYLYSLPKRPVTHFVCLQYSSSACFLYIFLFLSLLLNCIQSINPDLCSFLFLCVITPLQKRKYGWCGGRNCGKSFHRAHRSDGGQEPESHAGGSLQQNSPSSRQGLTFPYFFVYRYQPT